MDKIEKIRQEIKRRHDYENEMYHKKKPDGRPNDGWAESLAIMGVLEELLTFLDTLSEEPDKSLEEAAEEYEYEKGHLYHPSIKEIFITGAEWAFRQGWTFDAHKGAFGICFDGNIDNLLDSLKDKEVVTVQIRKK